MNRREKIEIAIIVAYFAAVVALIIKMFSS